MLPFSCLKKNGKGLNKRVKDYIALKIMKLTDMNEYEIQNFKQQSKYTQLLFEDLLMIILDALVIFGVFSVPELT